MLDKTIFLKAIQELSNYYINFSLNQAQAETWYKAFANYTNEEFKNMCVVFMNKSEFPPLSPANIKNKYGEQVKKQLVDKEMTTDEAWNLVRSAIQVYSPHYFPNEYIEYITDRNQIAGELAREYIHEIDGATSESLNYLATRFKKSYEVMLNRKVEDNQLLLTNSVIKNLLWGGNVDVNNR